MTGGLPMNQNFDNSTITNQINQCEQIIHQLMNQTQQASQTYQHMLQQEQQNASRLHELAQLEQKAAQTIQQALQGHQLAMQQMQQVTQICRQLEQTVRSTSTAAAFNPTYNNNSQFGSRYMQ
jgi:hypothetical protein